VLGVIALAIVSQQSSIMGAVRKAHVPFKTASQAKP